MNTTLFTKVFIRERICYGGKMTWMVAWRRGRKIEGEIFGTLKQAQAFKEWKTEQFRLKEINENLPLL